MTQSRNAPTAPREATQTRLPLPLRIDYALTKQAYGLILVTLYARSWGFWVLLAAAPLVVWLAVLRNELTIAWIYLALLVAIPVVIFFGVNSRRNRNAFLPVRFTFAETTVTIESGLGKQTVSWDAFARWRKVGSHYLLYASKRRFYAVPTAKLPPGQQAAFEELLSRKIGQH